MSAVEPVSESRVVSRVGWLFLFAVPTAVMITAMTLTPNPVGHGTHTQLGLPPCGFLMVTGLPCPGCGLTTCFTHMIRGQVVMACHANAFGVALFLVSFFTIPIAAAGFVRGWRVLETLDRLRFERVAIMLAASSALVWMIRIARISGML
jgi:hypothetical protein